MDTPAANSAAPPALPRRGEFSEAGYLQLHPDVAAAIEAGVVGSAWQHFVLHGFAEGRQWIQKVDPLIGVSREIAPDDEMFQGNEDHYFDAGESALHCIETALFAAQRERSTVARILDLPCGHGRVMRFLQKAFPAAKLTACDLNRGGVEFCVRTFGAEPVISSVEIECIPFRGQFDLIWCGSLLTHLPEERCAAFLRLFQQRLQPRGLLVFTLHGRRSENELVTGKHTYGLTAQQITELLVEYRGKGFGYVDYTPAAGYGISLALPSFVMANFVQRPGWQLLGYHEGGWDKRQDVICLVKA